jgi:hypothetical protein
MLVYKRATLLNMSAAQLHGQAAGESPAVAKNTGAAGEHRPWPIPRAPLKQMGDIILSLQKHIWIHAYIHIHIYICAHIEGFPVSNGLLQK